MVVLFALRPQGTSRLDKGEQDIFDDSQRLAMGSEGSANLLDTAYERLGYAEVEGQRFLAASCDAKGFSEQTWTDKGDWLALAKDVGAERVFFLGNNPVVVFARSNGDDKHALRNLYHRVWSMARPRLLFLARPGTLAVYDLAHRPPGPTEDLSSLEAIEVARSVAEVGEKLKSFRREEVETGRVFEAEKRFGKDLNNRADKALIHDLKAVRKELIAGGLGGKKLKYAHALIGRSIFIRYLEDRGVLTAAYFREVAKARPEWVKMLMEPTPPGLLLDEGQDKPLYPSVLGDHDFTYALFRRLADDFNGDMFPDIEEEARTVAQPHLDLLRDLMYGDVGRQRRLFFHAYRFDVIPIELISSIYEEFYHKESGRGSAYGAFYTPPALVDFVLSQVLTPERLAQTPRIIDPACGSGIFLVEAFRRIVRYRVAHQKRRLRFDELQKILRDQLAGIEIEGEAVRVAAFSLYLAMLHYLEPHDILEQIQRGNRLPCLVVPDDDSASFNCLVRANAFDHEFLSSGPALRDRFSSNCADIVVGNPPWGSPGPKEKEARAENQVALEWCEKRGLPVGDRERSQTFIWRALDLLKPGGISGLLVSTGVLLKHHPNTVSFRRKWLRNSQLGSVFNFAHTRQVFFGPAIAPFAAAVFHKKTVQDGFPVEYWSAKRTRAVEGLQVVAFSASDRHVISPDDDLADHRTWKTLWWGNHRDLRLISHLRSLPKLAEYTAPGAKGQGFTVANKKNDADWLLEYEWLPTGCFRRYGPIDWTVLVRVPEKIRNRGIPSVYHGLRLLIGRGIDESRDPKGQIVARLERRNFAFTNAIHGVKLPGLDARQHRIILGILWSSLARYFYFLTSGDWGIWHHEIGLDDELLTLPICLPRNAALERRIAAIVNELRDRPSQEKDLFPADSAGKPMTAAERRTLEARLDKAVFELYGLKEEEVDLIRDLCDTGLDFLYRRGDSKAAKPVLHGRPDPNHGDAKSVPDGPFGHYVQTFTQGWSAYLNEDEKLCWSAHVSAHSGSMLAVVFTVHHRDETPGEEQRERSEWQTVLRQLDGALEEKISSRIYIDGLARAVTDDSIIIIKRNELRLWTKSMAREDAEATLVQAMNRSAAVRGIPR